MNELAGFRKIRCFASAGGDVANDRPPDAKVERTQHSGERNRGNIQAVGLGTQVPEHERNETDADQC